MKSLIPKRSSFDFYKCKFIKTIYRDIESNDPQYSLRDHFKNLGEVRPSYPEKRYWQNLSLQDIVDLVPPETKLCNIGINISDPGISEYTEVSFLLYERDFDAEEEAYQKALKAYNDRSEE